MSRTNAPAAFPNASNRQISREEVEAEAVTGVPLHFGTLPASYGQHKYGAHRQAYATAPAAGYTGATSEQQVCNSADCGKVSDTAYHPRGTCAAPPPTSRLPVEQREAPENESAESGGIVRSVIVFPLRVVGFTVALPFRLIGIARTRAGDAISRSIDRREQRRKSNLGVRQQGVSAEKDKRKP